MASEALKDGDEYLPGPSVTFDNTRMKTFSLFQSRGVNRGWRVSFLVLSAVFFAATVEGQSPPPEAPPPPEQDARERLSPEELDRLLAPIALYPDALIALILPASTVPSDLVLAARYLGAKGDPAQIADQPWDDSVKSLARYPDVLNWMDQNLDWTTTVGDAFLDQPADVMNSVQRLRAEALAAGNLFDTPQQTIIKEETSIRIVPTEPEVIYVPEYDPEVVYVQPYSQDLGPVLTFGAGFAVGSWLTYDLDWNRRGIYVGRWRPGWKRDRDWNRGDRDWDRGDRDWDRGDRDGDRGPRWDRGDRGSNNTFIDVVNINSDTARQWQPAASSQRRQAQEQRVRRANARFSNVEATDVNRAPAGANTTGLAEDSRINQLPRPSRFDGEREGRGRDRRNARENRNDRSNDLPAAQIPPSDAAQGNNQRPPVSAASSDVAGEQGPTTPGGSREKDSRDKRDRGNRQGANVGQADGPSEARGKDRKVPEATVAPNVAGELGAPGEIGEPEARSANKQGRGSRQSASTGMPDATSEAKDKNRKAPQPSAAPSVAGEQGMPPAAQPESAARGVNEQGRGSRKDNDPEGANGPGRNRKPPQPTAAPNVAGEQKMPPATSDQEGSRSNVNKQEKNARQEPAAVDASRDRGRPKGDGQGSDPRESKRTSPPSGSQAAAVDTGAPKQKEQKQVEQRPSTPPQPDKSQQRSNERKREQNSPSPPAAPPKQDKFPPQQSAQPQRDQQPKRSAAPAQKNEPAQPPTAPKGEGKGGGKKGDKKDKDDK